MKKFINLCLSLSLTLVFFGCGQGAHLNGMPPEAGLNNVYSGDDDSSGDYKIDISAGVAGAQPLKGNEKFILTFESTTENKKLFEGSFKYNDDLKQSLPLSINSGTVEDWKSLQSHFKEGQLVNGGQIIFDKLTWAKSSGSYYSVFKNDEVGTFVPESERQEAQGLKLSLTIVNEFGLTATSETIMPIRYKYAFDDEALAEGEVGLDGSLSYSTTSIVSQRIVPGLEYVSNPALISKNPKCKNDFGLAFAFDFIEMSYATKPYVASEVSLRTLDGSWTKKIVETAPLLNAIGTSLGGQKARFTPITKYEGLCNRKVWGIVVSDKFVTQNLNGIKMQISNGTIQGEIIYSLMKLEAF